MRRFALWKNEKILRKTKFSWVALVPKIFQSVFFFGGSAAIFGILLAFFLFPEKIFLLGISFFSIGTFSAIIYFFKIWRTPVLFVTNKRVIFRHKKSFWTGKKVEIRLENISEIVFVKKSFLNSVFNFGSIFIYSLSGTQRFRIFLVPNAQEFAEFITELCDQKEIEDLPFEKKLEILDGVVDFFEMSAAQREKIAELESPENRGVFEILKKERIFCVLRNKKINFPPEAICALPNEKIENFLKDLFSAAKKNDGILLVGV